MDFVTALLHNLKGKNAFWITLDCLTKVAQFLSICIGPFTELLAEKYMQEIMRLHGVSISIALDRDT